MTLKVDGTNGVLQAYDYQVLTTGFSYTFAAGTQLLLAVPAGTLATGTVTMPASPVDGMNITITSTQQITALTVNANTGQSIVGGATSLKAGGTQTFVYRLSNTTWYNQNNNTSAGLPGTQGQVFTSNGTFTIPSGVTAVKVTVVGGGGGGAGSGTYYNYTGGGGGGGGGAAIKYLTGLTSGATVAVTIGAGGTAGPGSSGTGGGTGGTSSVASGTQTITTVSATGGVGGTVSTTSSNGAGGDGGLGSGGDLNIGGDGGGAGRTAEGYGSEAAGGVGGSSIFGGGGKSTSTSASTGSAGSAGRAYGGGGSGATRYANNLTGGAGAAGVVIFEW